MKIKNKERDIKEISKHVGYFIFFIAFVSMSLSIALLLAKPTNTLNFLISWLTLMGIILGDYLLFKILLEISE